MKVLDLFSGIGGFSLGLDAAGLETAAFCEIEPFCRAVLKKHWPDVPCHEDITKLDGKQYEGIDIICGGFPCQDISVAGKGAGLAGKRSGLWFEYLRIIKEAKPRYVLIENVSALRSRGLEEVLRSLAEIGYDAEWHCIPASAVGAPHRRDRVWLVAYSRSAGWDAGNVCKQRDNGEQIKSRGTAIPSKPSKTSASLADANTTGCLRKGQAQSEERRRDIVTSGKSEDVPNAESEQTRGILAPRLSSHISASRDGSGQASSWSTEPDVGRVADGVPARVHRLKALGNSIVPKIAEIIGNAIMEYENART